MSEEFDPKLKEAAEEIKAVLTKHDIGGCISLISKTHGEFVNQFPTWSGVQSEEQPDGGLGLRIRYKAVEVEKAHLTTHLVVSHMQIMEMLGRQYQFLFDRMREKALISFSAIEKRVREHKPEMLVKKDS